METNKTQTEPTAATAPKVYQAIANITAALAKDGIAKGRKNQQQGYQFRGIDDVYNALASELASHRLCVLPCVLERTCEERATKSGGTLFYVNLKVRFDFVSAEDGSKHEVVTLGEAMDSGDKATNKAMSAAYKYAAMMAFCIPTEGDNDTENQTHEVAAKPERPSPQVQTPGAFWTKAKLIIPFSDAHLPPEGEGYSPEAMAAWETNFLTAVGKAPNRELLAKLQVDNQHILDLFEASKTHTLNEACVKRATTYK